MLLISPKELFLVSRYWSFCLDFLVMWQNSLLRKISSVSNFMVRLVKEQSKYTYCPIFWEVKAISQWNLVSWENVTWETFFLKNHTQNMIEKLVPDPFLKNLNWPYLFINSLRFSTVCFYCMQCWGLLKHIKNKLLAHIKPL